MSTGHVIVAATGEFHAFADDPRKPSEGRNYSSDGHFVKKLEIYVNGSLRGTGKKAYFSTQGCLLNHVKLEPGDREVQFRVAYGIGDVIFDEETIGPMQILAGASLFGWFHVSGCGKYTNVYKKSYGSLDEFRQAIGVSRSEIKGKLS